MAASTSASPLPGALALLLTLGCSGGVEEVAPAGAPIPALMFTALGDGAVEPAASPQPEVGLPEGLSAALALPTPSNAPAPYTLLLDSSRDRRPAIQLLRESRAGLATITGEPLADGACWVAFDACLVSDQAGATEELIVGGVGHQVNGRWRTILQQAPDGPGALEFERGTAGTARSALLLSSPRIVEPDSAQPTVILITSDTHRADHVSTINPGSPVSTPHIDRLGNREIASHF